jgi:fibronectin-binding autotransporter adhesin
MNGGTLDLRGNSQAIGAVSSTNQLPGGGGNITNSTGTLATFTHRGWRCTTEASSPAASGLPVRATPPPPSPPPAPSPVPTTIRGGILELRDQGALSNTSGINAQFGTLQFNEQALYSGVLRVPTSISMVLAGATLNVLGNQTASSTGTVSVAAGQSTLNVAPMTGNVAASSLTVGNLTRSAGGAVNFTGTNLGQAGFATSQIFLTNVDGAAPALTNGILGGWATVAGTDFASYMASNGTQGGVGALNTLGFPYYSAALLGSASTTDNINITNTGTSGVTTRTINSLRLNPSGAATVSLNSATDVLTIASGGLLMAANQTLAINTGSLTSGTSALFAYINQNTTTIGSTITGAIDLVKGGAGGLTLTGQNTFTGTLYANQGTTTLNLASANATTLTAVAGDVVINNAALTLSAAGQIKSTANVTLNGGATLTLAGSNAFNSVVFNNTGANANAQITGGTLTLTGALTSTNDTLSNTPTIASTVDLSAAPGRSTSEGFRQTG